MFHIQQFRVDYLLQALLKNFSSNSTIIFSFHQVSPLLSTVFFVLGIGGILFLIRKISGFTHALKEPSVILELTPPSNVEQSAFMTEQLCNFLHSLGERISIQERILGKKSRFALEIVSSQDKGIRYLLRTGSTNADVIQKAYKRKSNKRN